MHVTFVTGGTQGDVQPMLALAVGLQNAGEQVRFCAHPVFEAFVRRSGVPFFPLSANDPRDVQRYEHGRTRKSRIATLIHILRRHTEQLEPERARLWEACQSTDAVVFPPIAGSVYNIVEHLGLPCCMTWLHPQYPTRFLPSPLGPPPLPLGQAYNLFTHLLMQSLFWLPTRSWVNRWRTKTLGLAPISWLGPLRLMRKRQVPMLFGFSPKLVSRPPDWPEWLHVTGFWFLERTADWSPPEGLERFIDAGPPPLSIGFGSVIDTAAEELLRNILAALSATGQRAVLVSGWSNYAGPLPDNVFPVESVPYDWLFPRVSAAIHAAGAGTVAEVLRAGIPSICVPFAGEQKFYARKLEDLGVAASPIDPRHATMEGLAAAIKHVTQDQAMRDRAKSFGDIVARENGVKEAVRLLQDYLELDASIKIAFRVKETPKLAPK